jgi:hypothetical protein
MSRTTSAEVVTDLRTWVEDARPLPSPALATLLEPVPARRPPSVPRPTLRRAARVGLVMKLTAVLAGIAVTAAAAVGVTHVVTRSGPDHPEPGVTAAPTPSPTAEPGVWASGAPRTSPSARPAAAPSARHASPAPPAPTSSIRGPSDAASDPAGQHRPSPAPEPTTSDGTRGSGDPTGSGDGTGDAGGTPTSDPTPGDTATGTTD